MAKAHTHGSGWHKESLRHSNARKHGKAGGKYHDSWSRIAGGYEVNERTGKVRPTLKYGEFGEQHKKDMTYKQLESYRPLC